MPTIELTEEEEKLLLDLRAQKEQIKANIAKRREILRVAYEYETWLQENGAGSTYSTFCDNFGYTGADREEMYHDVGDVRKKAHDLAYGVL